MHALKADENREKKYFTRKKKSITTLASIIWTISIGDQFRELTSILVCRSILFVPQIIYLLFKLVFRLYWILFALFSRSINVQVPLVRSLFEFSTVTWCVSLEHNPYAHRVIEFIVFFSFQKKNNNLWVHKMYLQTGSGTGTCHKR